MFNNTTAKDVLAAVGAVSIVLTAAHSVAGLVRNKRDDRAQAALEAKVASLEKQLEESKSSGAASSEDLAPSPPRKPVRVYLDGVFDMLHVGHSNALRQARAVGDELIVGLINDEEVIKNKGSAPVMTEEERYEALAANKFVTQVIRNAPYELHKEWVDELVAKHGVDFVVHGDDPCITADGKDAYGYAKSIGRFKLIKRTEGISTTDIVGRMLLMSRAHHIKPETGSSFLPTTRRLAQFSSGKAPPPGAKVVYIAGAWDLFNVGHVKALKKAKEMGDFLLVGIHDDPTVNKVHGGGYPILNLHERTLSVLACQYVDEVIIGAPHSITEDLIRTMNISVVARGTVFNGDQAEVEEMAAVPKRMGILQQFPSESSLTVADMVGRIMAKREVYSQRYEKKAKKEAEYYESNKEYHPEA